MFDPEKVQRLVIANEYTHCPEPTTYEHEDEVVVLASDYDELLALYRGSEWSRKAAMRLVEQLTGVLRSLRED